MRDDQINRLLKTLKDNLKKQGGRVMDAFHAVDVDRSGSLSPAEFAKCLSGFGIKLPGSALTSLVQKFDASGDGSISYAEFNAFMSGQENPSSYNYIRSDTLDALRQQQSSVERPPSSSSVRPKSASSSGRPKSALPRLGTPSLSELRRVPTPQQLDAFIEANDKPRARPRSAYDTVAKRHIYGELGPAMDGVINYPYSAMQRLYRDDFESTVMASITHPYCKTAKANASSLPHDILSGSNFDDGRISNLASWKSEAGRQYVPKDFRVGKSTIATGVRSECVRFIS